MRLSIRRVLLLVVAISGGGAAPVAAPQWSLDALLAAMSRAPKPDLRFVEERHLGYLTEPLIVEGWLRYAKGRLEKHTLKPREERLVIEGNRVTVAIPATGRRQRLILSDYPALEAFAVGMRATMEGDRKALKRLFWPRLEGGRDAWRLELTPQSETTREDLSAVRVTGRGGRIGTIEIVETGGDRIVIRIIDDG